MDSRKLFCTMALMFVAGASHADSFFNRSLGLGVNYDRYRAHVPYSQYTGPLTETSRVDTYTLTAEYRF